MFYPSSCIETVMVCEACNQKFTDVVKVVPDCGSSICGRCHSELKRLINFKSQYTCKACKQLHTLPAVGYKDMKAIMKLVKFKPQDKALTDKARSLKALLEDLEERVYKLKLIDGKEEINLYCDSLLIEVMEMVESGMKNLNKVGDDFTQKIEDYRQDLLAKNSQEPLAKRFKTEDGTTAAAPQPDLPKPDQEGEVLLFNEIKEFSEHWTEYFTDVSKAASDAEIDLAKLKIRNFETKIKQQESTMRSDVFDKRFLCLQVDPKFLSSRQNFAKLVTKSSLTNDDLLFTHESTFLADPAAASFILATSLTFLPDGNLACCANNHINVFNPRTGKLLYKLKGHTEWILSLAVMKNGLLASGSRDSSIRIWDLNDRKLIRTIKNVARPVFGLQVLPNGNLASSSVDGKIKIFNPYLDENSLVSTIDLETKAGIALMGMTSKGTLITCYYLQTFKNSIRTWNPETGQLIKTTSTGYQENANRLLVLSSDKVLLAFDKDIVVIDLDTGNKVVIKQDAKVNSLTELSNGLLLVTILDGSKSLVHIWDPETGKLVRSIKLEMDIKDACLSVDEKLFATFSLDRFIKTWSLNF